MPPTLFADPQVFTEILALDSFLILYRMASIFIIICEALTRPFLRRSDFDGGMLWYRDLDPNYRGPKPRLFSDDHVTAGASVTSLV